jgi:hypothetical protein
LRIAGELGSHVIRQSQIQRGLLYRLLRVAQREARFEVEADRRGRILALMPDGERGDASFEARDLRQRHLRSVRGADLDAVEQGGIDLQRRIDFQNHLVLITLRVDRR